MSMHPQGDWPELPPLPPPLRKLSEHPTMRELIEVYLEALLLFGQLWPRTVQALEWLHAWTIHHDRVYGHHANDTQLPSPPRTMRDPEDSWYGFDTTIEKTRQELRAQVKDPRRPDMTSERAQAIAEKVYQTIKKDSELTTWRRIKGALFAAGKEVLKALVPLLVGGGAVELWHWLGRGH